MSKEIAREKAALEAMDRMAEQIERATIELRQFIAEQRKKREEENDARS